MLRPQQLADAVEALDLGAVHVGLELVGEPPCLTPRGHSYAGVRRRRTP
jgi:hypothetical protein